MQKVRQCLLIKRTRDMRDESSPISLYEFERSLEKVSDIKWVSMDPGRGFVAPSDPDFRVLFYESHGGIAVHFHDNDDVLNVCESAADLLGAKVIVL